MAGPNPSRTRRSLLAVALLAAAVAACPAPPEDTAEEDLGPIEGILDEITMTVWPGVEAEEGRHVRRVNGFFAGEPTAYWFAGFASRVADDVFWFCREGDTACPFDETGAVDWDHVVGHPVFSRMPGEFDYSPFWLAWVVYVPHDYRPDDIKSVYGIEQASKAEHVRVEQVVFDHGGDRGPDLAIMHCLLVLEGTELQHNGGPLITDATKSTRLVPVRTGWFNQLSVNFFEFTETEGVFAPDPASPSVPLMPSADIFVFFRDCENGSTSASCDTITADVGAVSERGVELDLTDDGDREDNNNIISGFPRTDNVDARDKPYSPFWRVNRVLVPVEHDGDVALIDSTKDQEESDAQSTDDIRALVEAGLVNEPEPLTETDAGNPIPGNDGTLFFNCPSQVAE